MHLLLNFRKRSLNCLTKIKREGALPNEFYKPNVTLIPKPDNDTIRKKIKNCRPTSLMKINVNSFESNTLKLNSRIHEEDHTA